MSYPTLDISKGILLSPNGSVMKTKNPACPKKGDCVLSTSPTDKFYGKVGIVQEALTHGFSYLVLFQTQHGVAFIRYLRENLEVIEKNDLSNTGSTELDNIYRRYARIRLMTIIDTLNIILNSSGVGDSIKALVAEARKMAYKSYDKEEALKFLKDQGLPSGEVK